ncbi:crossover junction endodeoxyribonuclease RuvC [Micavibrio aeruginosavorus]|uniref:Crossover junction endodeoxyribonuclease RuvC n=1 Tax=Micavibrio aeruginosavorus EPB TaxID=349215 RepID=M4VEZ4_9BACT|nr:crossover junction endodeoxyribonuclease RuvC [Micavibrio aeruginosavorus]AGH97947.1 Crossover junction endodeoxyribonuclease RuvC [Micavibrio aeruginosavorus EPB]
MRILGIDPGLQRTGWGVIEAEGNRLQYIACGTIATTPTLSTAERLAEIDAGLVDAINTWQPDTAAIEETFVNRNPASALKLGVARGAAMVVPARMGLSVGEYPANLVKKSVVGTGHATKDQIGMMIRTLLPSAGKMGADAADALAIAICHAHHYSSRMKMGGIMNGGVR